MLLASETHAADVFALAMLGVMALAMGVIGMLFYCMRRAAANRDAQVDALLEEVAQEERNELAGVKTQPRKPRREEWEREADWWKK